MRMEPRSKGVSRFFFERIQLPMKGCSNWPATKGRKSCSMIFQIMSNEISASPPAEKSRATRTGVRKIPRMFEVEAAHIAAGTLPPAIDVKAIDDCTVEGRTHRNKRPR